MRVRYIGSTPTSHCPHGHAYDEENTQLTPGGYRRCLACHRLRAVDARRRRKAEACDPASYEQVVTLPAVAAGLSDADWIAQREWDAAIAHSEGGAA